MKTATKILNFIKTAKINAEQGNGFFGYEAQKVSNGSYISFRGVDFPNEFTVVGTYARNYILKNTHLFEITADYCGTLCFKVK